MSQIFCFLLLLAPAPSAAQGRVLTLDEALRTAAERQPQLRAAGAQVGVSAARVGEARAGFLPRLDGQFQYQRSGTNFVLSPSFANSAFARSIMLDNTLDTVNYYLFGATATETLYDFGRTSGQVEQARAAELASRADLESALQQTALAVRTAYFNVLASKALVWVGEETVKNQGKHVEQVRQFVAAGTRPKIDLRSAELNLANAELQLVRARNQLDLAKLSLNLAMGVEAAIDYDVAAPTIEPLPEESQATQALVDQGLRERPELAKLDAQLRAQQAARRTAASGYYPALVAVGSLNGAKVADFDWGVNFYIGAGMTWNLYGGFLTTHQIDEAEAGLAALSAQREALKQSIRSDLEQQLLAVAEAKQRLQVSERAVATAEERLKLAEGRYQAGAGDILELDDAQVTQANAQAQKVGATYDLAIARARLARALGRR